MYGSGNFQRIQHPQRTKIGKRDNSKRADRQRREARRVKHSQRFGG